CTRVIAHPTQSDGFTTYLESARRRESGGLAELKPGNWSEPLRNIISLMRQRNRAPRGANILIEEDFPDCAGLGGRASLEVAAAFALLEAAGTELPRLEIAQLCRLAERLRGADSTDADPF